MSKAKPANPSEDVTKTPPMALGPEKSVLSSILQEPAKYMKLALNEGVVSDDFYVMSHRYLFEFLLKLWNAEQEIELVSLVQRLLDNGLLDKVGGPSTVSDLYTYAAGNGHFNLHLGQVKDKAVLREIIRKANQQIRAAYEQPDEVKDLVDKCATDAAEVQIKTENRASAFKKYKTQIATAEEMEQGVKDALNGDRLHGGDPFFLPDFDLGFRKFEWTVWVGASFHGKSTAVENQIANLAAHGKKSIVASLEQPAEVTFSKILNALVAYPDLVRSAEFSKAYSYLNSMVSMYKDRSRASPKRLLETFRQAYLNDGTDTMVIDNLFCLDVDRGDNSALSNAIHLFRAFVADYPVHLHLVCHPRKPPDELANKPPSQNSIRGPAEIGDAPDNIIVIWRDLLKGEKIAEMENANFSESEINTYWSSTPCTKILVRKQRTGGRTPVTNCWFHSKTNRFIQNPGKPYPMFDIPPWETIS